MKRCFWPFWGKKTNTGPKMKQNRRQTSILMFSNVLMLWSVTRRCWPLLAGRAAPARPTWSGRGHASANSTTGGARRASSAPCAAWVLLAWAESVCSGSPLQRSTPTNSCVNPRCCGTTVCVSVSAMEACCPCSLTCSGPERYYLNSLRVDGLYLNKTEHCLTLFVEFFFLFLFQVYGLENSRMSKQLIEQVNETRRHHFNRQPKSAKK